MKKALTAVALIAFAGLAAAKGGERMLKGLDLTEAQRSEIQTLSQEHRGQMRALQMEHRTEIRALLTPEQQVKFDERMAELAKRMEKRMAKKGY